MKLERIRDALTDSGWNGEGPDECPACGRVLPAHNNGCAIGPDAWAELDLAEQVIEVARELVNGTEKQAQRMMGNSPYVSLHGLRAALRALDGAAP